MLLLEASVRLLDNKLSYRKSTERGKHTAPRVSVANITAPHEEVILLHKADKFRIGESAPAMQT